MSLNNFDLMAAARRWPTSSSGERFTLLTLVSYMGMNEAGEWTAWPGNKTLATDTVRDERTIKRHLAALHDAGLISTRRRPAPDGRGRASNTIVLDADLLIKGTSCPDDETTKGTSEHDQGDIPSTTKGTFPTNAPHIEPPEEPPVEGAPSGATTTRGSRCPDPFLVTPEMWAWAAKEVPTVDGHDQTARFVDYWRAKSGKDATKLDWVGTWRNWLRRAADDARGRRGPSRNDTLAQRAGLTYDDDGMLLP